MAKILAVDDVPDNLKLLMAELEDLGYEVITASGGRQALEQAKAERPDVILLDIMMPDLDGIEVCRRLKATPELEPIPVLLVSALDQEDEVVRGLDAGAQDFISKPFHAAVLAARVRAAVRVKEVHDTLELRVAERTTDLQRANASLTKLNAQVQQSHRETAQLLAAISSILISIDASDTITQWNTKAEQTFGLSHTETVGWSVHAISLPWDGATVLAGIAACRHTAQPVRLDDVRFTRCDGTEGSLGLTISPVAGAPQDTLGVLVLARDITERRLLESQLAQAQKLEAIGQLAAGIAHEINTPTQYVSDNTRFLRDAFEDLGRLLAQYAILCQAASRGAVTDSLLHEVEGIVEEIDLDYLREEIPTAIQQSLEGLENIATIVRAMKEFSHPGSAEKTAIDLNQAIENTITVARNEWKYVAEMVTDFDALLPKVLCLPGEINQAILNMVVNAAHAIAEAVDEGTVYKGTITVHTRRAGDWAEIDIADTGTGIPEEIRQKVFDPFFTTKEVGRGTGQGLSITHHVVVEKHGGTIRCASVVGQGTTFTIRLPLAAASA